MQFVVALVALGAFFVLNFVKVKSIQGPMRLIVYGSRMITFLISLVFINYYWNHQKERGLTFLGDSIDKIDEASFIGEWGWIHDGHKETTRTIIFKQNSEFDEPYPNRTIVGKWSYDENTKALYLHYPERTDEYHVQGKSGIKIMFEAKSNSLFSNSEFSLIRRDNSGVFSSETEESKEENMLRYVFWILIILFFIILLAELLRIFYRLKNSQTLSVQEQYFLNKLNIFSGSLKSTLFNLFFYMLILIVFVKECG